MGAPRVSSCSLTPESRAWTPRGSGKTLLHPTPKTVPSVTADCHESPLLIVFTKPWFPVSVKGTSPSPSPPYYFCTILILDNGQSCVRGLTDPRGERQAADSIQGPRRCPAVIRQPGSERMCQPQKFCPLRTSLLFGRHPHINEQSRSCLQGPPHMAESVGHVGHYESFKWPTLSTKTAAAHRGQRGKKTGVMFL